LLGGARFTSESGGTLIHFWEGSIDLFAPAPGDYNASGTVEQADLDLVLLNWGADAATPPAGWINHLPVGVIDQTELDAVLLNWGQVGGTPAPASVVAAVPEPNGMLLGMAVAIVGLAISSGTKYFAGK
jgi:hypothetical protein